MTEQDASQQTSAPVFDVLAYAAERSAIVALLEIIDASAYKVLRAFQAAHPELVPCGSSFPWQDERQLEIWTISEADDSGITFTHDCMDHGYDLYDTQSVTVPAGWIWNGPRWDADHKAELDRAAAREAAAQEDARRTQFEALRAEFGPLDV